jgi:hypothetical protein
MDVDPLVSWSAKGVVMCCLSAVVVFFGARLGVILWWIFDQERWSLAFDSFWIGFLGFLFVPWLTLSYVLVFPGGVTGFDWVILAVGLLLDIGSYTGGGYSRQQRYA